MDHAEFDHVGRTLEFFARWSVSYDAMCASFRDLFGPACVWDQRPMARTTGPDEALRFLRLSHRALGLETIDVTVLSTAVSVDTRSAGAPLGAVVHTERVDHLRRADGGLIVSAPVAGVLTFRDGELVHWREYFDAAGLGVRAAGSTVAATVRRLGRHR